MDRAVGISVTCIDSEYGFTLVNILDGFTGEKLARLSISAETIYGLDPGTDHTIVKINQSERDTEDTKVMLGTR